MARNGGLRDANHTSQSPFRRSVEGPGGPASTLLVGSGKLGGRLAGMLAQDGVQTFALRRRTGDLPPGVKAISADLRAPLPEALPPVDAMVITLPPSVDPGGYGPVLRRLRAALSTLPARTIFVSSTGVFEGWDGPQPITERDIPRPMSERAKTLRDGEIAAIDLLNAVVVRPAGIYGPGREFLVRTVREGRPISSRTRTNRIHEKDLVRALHSLLDHANPPRLLHAVDAEPAPLGDVTSCISRLLGLPPPPERDVPGRAGNIFDGAELRLLLGALQYPSYRDGYGEMLADRLSERGDAEDS